MRKDSLVAMAQYQALIPEISYEVLSDDQQRSLYDQLGEAGLKEGGMGGGVDPQDLFSQLFGGGGGFFGGGTSIN